MNTRFTCLAALATSSASLLAQATMTDLGHVLPPGGPQSTRATAVSADGSTVVGTSSVGPAGSHAFRWTANAGIQDLGAPGGNGAFGILATASSVNHDGSVVVGSTTTSAGFGIAAFRWTPTGVVPINNAQAFSTDDSGNRFTGTLRGAAVPFTNLAAVFDVTPQGLQLLDNPVVEGSAVAVSGNGSVVAFDGGRLWSSASGFRAIGALSPVDQSRITAINADGTAAVGVNATPYPLRQAVRWTLAGGLQGLGYLPNATAHSAALDISADGNTVVGWSAGQIGDVLFTRAFLWTPELGMLDLASYAAAQGADVNGWTLTSANGVSADGRTVVGEGIFNGVTSGFVLTNLPTPNAAALLALGIASVSRRRRGS